MTSDAKQTIEAFAKKSPALCLSTCGADGQPHSSLIYYGLDQDLTIYFFSKEDTRKCTNMAENPKVSLLMQNVAEEQVLQMEGVAERIVDRKELEYVFDFMMQTLSRRIAWPPPAGRIDGGDLAFYKIKLTWARLGHFKGHEKDIFTELIP